LDKTSSQGKILRPDWQFSEEKIDEKTFLSTIKHFMFQTTKIARLLMRDELRQAHTILEQSLRVDFLRLLEMEARIRTNDTTQTWYDGRRLDEWANPNILKKIPETFGQFDLQSQAKALLALSDLFEELSQNISDQTSYAFPQKAFNQIKAWLCQTIGSCL
jgi:aminoglycoside 6-adenylyltransferase